MAQYRDIVAFQEFTRNGEKRSRSTRIGVAFPTKNGNFALKFDFFPADPANTELVICKPKDAGESDEGDEA